MYYFVVPYMTHNKWWNCCLHYQLSDLPFLYGNYKNVTLYEIQSLSHISVQVFKIQVNVFASLAFPESILATELGKKITLNIKTFTLKSIIS